MTPDLRVAPSRLHGRGVFAGRDFEAGELIETCPVLVVPADQLPELERTALRGYYYDWDEGDVALALGLGSLYNHSFEPNAWTEVDVEAGVVTYWAERPIADGTEITIDYTGGSGGEALWFDPATAADDQPKARRRARTAK